VVVQGKVAEDPLDALAAAPMLQQLPLEVCIHLPANNLRRPASMCRCKTMGTAACRKLHPAPTKELVAAKQAGRH
jgi:hypothetical protein